MAVSGKSIIHYSQTLESIQGIISVGAFRLKYCRENIL
jgi:hypothetical protein